ncbi:MAG TPA: SDR family oxidoreductase [Bryobacteraceae bacterium]|nr:SDR family oxidoreductase [Bryobacteraceae bacterium]
MLPKLEGKRAVVTGASKGIGRAIADSLARAGATVAICARDAREVAQTAAEISSQANSKIVAQAADVSQPASVSKFFAFVDAELGGVDILVNNAGVGIFRSVADLTVENWRTTLETNLSGVFYCCHEALPRMRKAGGGFIVNISSLAGKNPFEGGAAYNASKFALNGFSEAMMLDHRNDNIRVTYIMPGSVDTGFTPGAAKATWKIAPEDVAQIVLDVLAMPERTLISRVEVRPSKPPQ